MWKLLLSASVCISLAMSLVFCLCWKKKNPEDEWLGVDGMVTQKNPDENVNHLPSAASCVDGISSGESVDKRNVITNSRRSLPDIPSELVATVNWEPNGDNSSEHYATLGQYQNAGKKNLVNGPETRPSISQHSSISQADDAFSPYERVKYDKIKSREHPYAQLQPNTSRSVFYEENPVPEERTTLLRTDAASTSTVPSIPIRSRRSSAHSSGGVDIPAASAVAGGIAASYELPYMTPPVTQSNFSGDSQDSSKGYTSISVREPLANILAQTQEMNKQKRSLDVHYSTVSDDSDDVYTTIPDPNNQIYTSESETYARIPPLPLTVEAEINIAPTERGESTREIDAEELYELSPQPDPPSVDSLKHVSSHTHTHSRQASSSSSTANVGSPKPEKRQANSPLPPPPPTLAANYDVHGDKPVPRNLDDLYAKVHKNKKDDINEDRLSKKGSLNESLRNSFILTKGLATDNIPEIKKEHSYETLRKTPRNSSDPGYEKIKDGLECEPGYASINGPESITGSSDPGYEVLRNRAPSEVDPNYEQLRHRDSNASDVGYSKVQDKLNDGYSIVHKKKKLEFAKNAVDPLEGLHYESEISEPNYAAVKSSGSDTDPNYESVSQSDPNYESVKDLKLPYEKLEEDSSRTNSELSGYEKIMSNNMSTDSSNSVNRTTESEPPYERLQNDIDSDIPGYEKVGKGKEGNSSASSGNEICPIQNESVETDISAYIHEEDAVVQV